MAHVLCIGNLQFDILCRPVSTLPAPGTLRKINAIDFALSGNGGNVAAALARLGVSVELAGYSGADLIGEQFRLMLHELKVGTSYLLRHPTASTGTSVITIAPGGERSILFVNGANEFFELDTIPGDWFREKKVVVVNAVFVLPQFTGEAVGRLFARARAFGCTTVLNVCYDSEGKGLPFLVPALRETDYFLLNFEEGHQLTGYSSPRAIIERLDADTRGQVILTLGADGCFLGSNDGIWQISALPVEATDTTGAGDSFVAGFVAGLIHGRSLYDCAQLGCKVAAFAVTGPGAYARIPPLAEIDQIDTTSLL
jgi:sugar/nucleoside kinase (ribokinase family)